MSTHRIEGLADGIFAIAMTLLVLNLALPEVGKEPVAVHSLLAGQLDKFLNYALSFILLAVFWIRHHQQFHLIKRTDRKHLWINVFFFMFAALIPFSTTLVGDYSREPLAEVFFASNIFMLGMLLHWNWIYATNQCRLVDRNLDPRRIASGKRRGVVTMLVAASAIGLAFINPRISSFVYLLIPILHGVLEHRHRRVTSSAA